MIRHESLTAADHVKTWWLTLGPYELSGNIPPRLVRTIGLRPYLSMAMMLGNVPMNIAKGANPCTHTAYCTGSPTILMIVPQ